MSARSPDFGGTTVNERLYTADLLGQFDGAIDAGNRQLAIELLERVAMSEDSAAAAVDAVFADPSKYGYPRPSLAALTCRWARAYRRASGRVDDRALAGTSLSPLGTLGSL